MPGNELTGKIWSVTLSFALDFMIGTDINQRWLRRVIGFNPVQIIYTHKNNDSDIEFIVKDRRVPTTEENADTRAMENINAYYEVDLTTIPETFEVFA